MKEKNIMQNMLLEKARLFEQDAEQQISASDRPCFHLSSRVGWMNDPNGFSFFNGQFHLFYQYHPYSNAWGPMHWGHAVTADLLRWDYLPAALAPETAADNRGCFSGSAITVENADGTAAHLLMYTGLVQAGADGAAQTLLQQQCLALGDGLNYRQLEANPVLTQADLPEGYSPLDFRDPKLFRTANGSYYAVIVGRKPDGLGSILLFESADAKAWSFHSVLAENAGQLGKMWECPDLLQMDGNAALLFSVQDNLATDQHTHSGDCTMYYLGKFDEATGDFAPESLHCLDYGFDFYAPQTTVSPDGRQILVAWLQNWKTANNETVDAPYFGQVTLPRELRLQDGRMLQAPVRELAAWRQNARGWQYGEAPSSLLSARVFDLEFELQAPTGETLGDAELDFLDDGEDRCTLAYNQEQNLLTLVRRKSDALYPEMTNCYCPLESGRTALKIRLIVDKFSVEVFVNDGQQTITATTKANMDATSISLSSKGETKSKLVLYDLVCEQ